MTSLIVISVVLTIFLEAVAEPILWMFGASEKTLPFALGYMRIYVAGSIFVMMTLGLNMFITTQGFAKISMKTVLIGAICNIILDPLFIFAFHMGVKGAAVATILSQAVSAVWVFSFLNGKQTKLRIRKEYLKVQPQIILLDEPTSFLDIRHKMELLTILKTLVRKKQVAVLMSMHELDLAQKISDHIICVKGDNSIGRFGTPEEIFSGDYIKELFQIEKGTYLTDYGSVELEAVKGEPKVFVIGGNGTGIPVYRQLQKEGIPFAAGILWENDREYPVAEALASVVIREKAFESVSDATFETAVKVLKNCEKVICCMENFGTYQEPCRQLWKIAKDLGKI